MRVHNLHMSKRKRETSNDERMGFKRKFYRKPYWNPPPIQTEDSSNCIPNLFAKTDGIHDYHKFIEMSSSLRRYYRKTYVETNVTNDAGLRHPDDFETEAVAGIVSKIPMEVIKCSYTTRKLKPIIFQDFHKRPLWLKMHDELRLRYLKKYSLEKLDPPVQHPLNFMYVTADHIPAINALAEVYFWPGIDISITLAFPEFSCVVLYKKIVVGFAMMSPGSSLNEAYISFLLVRPHWRGCGIGSFMIYHLINTCKCWNITLHASLSNDALLLYNKFGFNGHKVVRNFYDERLRIDTKESGHAVFMQIDKTVYSGPF